MPNGGDTESEFFKSVLKLPLIFIPVVSILNFA